VLVTTTIAGTETFGQIFVADALGPGNAAWCRPTLVQELLEKAAGGYGSAIAPY